MAQMMIAISAVLTHQLTLQDHIHRASVSFGASVYSLDFATAYISFILTKLHSLHKTV